MPDLLTLYEEASVSKTGVSKLLTKWANYNLLILDEFLLNDLTQPEQLLYKSLCLLYREYRSGQITREQALKDKKQMYSAYIDSAYMFDLYETYGKISEVFQHHSYEIKENGCDVCRRLDRLICGLPMRRRENERK